MEGNQYRVWVESRNDVVVSRDVIFDEKPTATLTTEIDDKPVIHDIIVVQSPPDLVRHRQLRRRPKSQSLNPSLI